MSRKMDRIDWSAKTAVCARCQLTKPFSDYYTRTGNGQPNVKGYPDGYCKPCRSVIAKERRTNTDIRTQDIHWMKQLDSSRRAVKYDVTYIPFTLADWQQKLRDWNHECAYCAVDLRTLPRFDQTHDHFVPLSRRGEATLANSVGCCRACNARKKSQLPKAFCGYSTPEALWQARFGQEAA